MLNIETTPYSYRTTPRRDTFLIKELTPYLKGNNRHCRHKGAFFVVTSRWERVFGGSGHSVIRSFFRCISEFYIAGRMTRAYTFDTEHLQGAVAEAQQRILTYSDAQMEFLNTYESDTVSTTDGVAAFLNERGCGEFYNDIGLMAIWRILSVTDKEQYHEVRSGGRRFTTGVSLQNCSKVNRRLLLKGSSFIDIDIANCHPTLFLNIAQNSGYEMPHLQNYIDNCSALRDTYHDIKDIVIFATYGMGWKRLTHRFQNFYNEDTLLHLVAEIKSTMKGVAKKFGVTENAARWLSLKIQEQENLHLSAMEAWCQRNNVSIKSLMFDGMVTGHMTPERVACMTEWCNIQTCLNLQIIIKEVF